MANFYRDNDDIQFLLEHLDVGELVAVCEQDFRFSGEFDYAPGNAEEAKQNYDMVLGFGICRIKKIWLSHQFLFAIIHLIHYEPGSLFRQLFSAHLFAFFASIVNLQADKTASSGTSFTLFTSGFLYLLFIFPPLLTILF